MNMKIAGRQFLQAWKIGRVVTESNRAIWCFFPIPYQKCMLFILVF